MSKGKHEAGGGSGWHRGGDPFQEEKAPKKPKAKKGKNLYGWNGLSRGQKAGVIAGCCLAALVLIVVGGWMLFVKPPDVSENTRPNPVNNDPNQTSPIDGETPGDETPDDDGTTKVPGRKDDVYTFLLLGKDTGGGGNTDTIILVSYDVPNGTVDCLSIPRDTMINVTWSIKRINAVYASKMGIDGLKEEVGRLTGIVPDFYVAVEWKAIGEIVEALGGVEFDVPYTMNYDDPAQNLHIHQSKGLRKLNGSDAMQVIRWRQNNDPDTLQVTWGIGDDGRQKIQQDFLKAVAKQCLQLGNWTKISQFAQIFFDNVTTDIKLENLLWFAQSAMGINMDNVAFYSLPGDFNGSYNHQSYVFADPAGVVELVNEHFNPYSRDITEADLQIMYKTKSGGLGVTNGTLASSSMANAPANSGGSSTATNNKPSTEAPTEPATKPSGGTGTGTSTGTGTTTDPNTATEPGTTPDPGTMGPGETEEPTLPTEPATEPITEPATEPATEPDPQPDPELPSEEDPEPVLPGE